MKNWGLVISITAFLVSCQPNKKSDETNDKTTLQRWKQPKTIAYKISDAKYWLQDSTITSEQRAIVFAVNRTDSLNFLKMDSVILPVDLSGDLVYYLPFPLKVSSLKEIDKIIFFSYPTQTFGAYEKGELVYTGPTNMGRERDQTPRGLFSTNWKAKKTISTFNDEWELRWNFNIMNKEGIGWHQYDLPGYPSSHSCLRLREEDAKYLYTWANQWVLADKTTVYIKGTPVIIFGNYDFKGYRPWFQLVHNAHLLDISEDEIKKITEPFFSEILEAQKIRKEYQLKMDAKKSAPDSLI
ncbi:L,D-transpeptidase [Fluviicola taffensis]|uniref:ErfK/YbiS/YcfS/YnhG family protein n=1 Tax=Fluviicola taffensis (strain DSM 16823 / NCIMB 13979 / RW262) TaxID=755732 RepID=F2IJH2_FLUTR|nr:L,D-transpeptidase [Fluviicola taffensis]AEA42860.1 ErfK/YbiS/YcfS/YnhG family protein [Fluviicola taffensis DSM 16823]